MDSKSFDVAELLHENIIKIYDQKQFWAHCIITRVLNEMIKILLELEI
jgi:hypothetical protein